ncbi:rod shape-determining protein [Rhodococcoides kyotonense]|nr:rod shape-determining protein [Rhodococcus kyotonensis]
MIKYDVRAAGAARRLESAVLVVGVGAGAHGARAILTYLDSPHRAPIASRTVRRRAGQSLVSAVSDGVSALHSVASKLALQVGHSAIAYRVSEDADAITAHGDARPSALVHETDAQLRYLRFTGTVPNHGSTVVCDMGSTGMTASVVDLAGGETVTARRTSTFCGDDLDHLIRRHLASNGVRIGVDRSRLLKEQLGIGGVVNAHNADGPGHHVLTRKDFEDMIAGPVRYATMVVDQTIELSGVKPSSIVLVGGGANVSSIGASFERHIGLRTHVPDRPELVSARGAALLSVDQQG